jgi:hypothetical protein
VYVGIDGLLEAAAFLEGFTKDRRDTREVGVAFAGDVVDMTIVPAELGHGDANGCLFRGRLLFGSERIDPRVIGDGKLAHVLGSDPGQEMGLGGMSQFAGNGPALGRSRPSDRLRGWPITSAAMK